jgi:pullulanase
VRPVTVLTIHYHRPDGDYDGWALWVWEHPSGAAARTIAPAANDAFGAVFTVAAPPAGRLGVLPYRPAAAVYDRPDRIWDAEMGAEIWIKRGAERIHGEPPPLLPALLRAFVDGKRRVTAVLEHPLAARMTTPAAFRLTNRKGAAVAVAGVEGDAAVLSLATHVLLPHREADAAAWTLALQGSNATPLRVRRILDAYESDAPLGARVENGRTEFAVFAPGAGMVRVELFADAEGGAPRARRLRRDSRGVWRATFDEDLTGTYYAYVIHGGDPDFDGRRRAVDPYGRLSTRHDGRSRVLAPRPLLPPGPSFPPQDAVIYELHVRDFTIDPESGVSAPGTFRGLAEGGARLAGLFTGLDHIVELGANVVQLMPVLDFPIDIGGGGYDWGYMPAHYFSPQGWFAADRAGDGRVDELRALVAALHERGLKVVFDVVYNHTCETEPDRGVCLSPCAPRYYYRERPDGTAHNGSGCGNELRTEAPMVRRLILDSLAYMVDAFGADGFRFDLLALMDADTVAAAGAMLRAKNPAILLYGEPWTAGLAGIPPPNADTLRANGFALFDDRFRDALRGNVFSSEGGFLSHGDNVRELKAALKRRDPLGRIIYAECHDNHTLWDRLALVTAREPHVTWQEREAMVRMGTALLLASPGIPLLHAGQEFLRTKNGAHDSYNLGDEINMIRWRAKVEHLATAAYVRGLIAMRRAHPIFRPGPADESPLLLLDDDLGLSVPPKAVGFVLRRRAAASELKEVAVLANANVIPQTFHLPFKRWQVFADHMHAQALPRGTYVGKAIVVPPRSAWILGRS